jgi:ATP-dependent helicase HrpA
VAYESVTLYGLPLADRRRVSYTGIDPAHSRDLMIRDGLVRGAVKRPLPFLEHNLARVAELQEREARGRRRDVLVSEDVQAALYDERLPAGICSIAELERWWRKADERDRRPLCFSEAELTAQGDVRTPEEDYPSQLTLRGTAFSLKYRFAPGEPDDGISIRVPVGALPAVVSEALEWSVPGFFPAVCEQWLKSLPKATRRLLAPVPDKVREMLPLLLREDRYRQGRLPVALAQAALDLFRVRIDADDWDRSRLDPHLLINVQVLDGEGRVLAQGRDADALKARFAEQVRSRVERGFANDIEQTELTRFPEDVTLADTLLLEDNGAEVVVYPALVDRGGHVDLRLLASADEQRQANARGYARLALLHVAQTARYLKKQVERERDLGLHYASLGSARQLHDELLRGAAWHCFFAREPLPRTAAAFDERIRARKGRLTEVFEGTVEVLRLILARRFVIARRISELASPAYQDALADAGRQLERLVPAGVLSLTPQAYLDHLPRYLDGLEYRLEHLQGKVHKDRDLRAVIGDFEARLERLAGAVALDDEAFQRLRFAVEELRIALFAEPLGTRGKMSPKRLDRDFLSLERELGLA